MKTRMKSNRLLGILLVLMMVLTLLPTMALAATDESWFVFDQATQTITGYSQDASAPKSIEIPKTINGVDVLHIGDSAFAAAGLTDVAFETGSLVESIGSQAFRGNPDMTSCVLPDTVTSIGSQAFYGCSSLTGLVIPDDVTSIGDSAFKDCSSLTSAAIPAGVTSIGDGTVDNCTALASVTIPGTVTTIGSAAFNNCSSLTSVGIPEGVTTIGTIAFAGCSGLTSVSIPNSMTTIGSGAFANIELTLTEIRIPGQTAGSIAGEPWGANCPVYWSNSIDLGGKYLCNKNDSGNLTVAKLLDSTATTADDMQTLLDDYNTTNGTSYTIIAIGASAFASCQKLTSVTIPSTVTEIGEYAFYSCDKLTSADLPAGVTSIGEGAFRGCSLLTSVTIPAGVTSIEENVFSGCSGLATLDIPNSVTAIKDYAFNNCSGLTSVEIPNSVQTIGTNAFSGCSKLTSMNIPDNVTAIGSEAFSYCPKMTAINIPSKPTDAIAGAPWGAVCPVYWSDSINLGDKYLCSKDDSGGLTIARMLTKDTTADDMQTLLNKYNTDNSTNYVIKAIGDGAFRECKKLMSATIPDGVISIGIRAFQDCTELVSVKIPASVTAIGQLAFSGCSGLTSITIPDGVTSLGGTAFGECDSLTSVTIPTSLKYIAGNTFDNCKNLTDIYITGWAKLKYPSSANAPFGAPSTTTVHYGGGVPQVSATTKDNSDNTVSVYLTVDFANDNGIATDGLVGIKYPTAAGENPPTGPSYLTGGSSPWTANDTNKLIVTKPGTYYIAYCGLDGKAADPSTWSVMPVTLGIPVITAADKTAKTAELAALTNEASVVALLGATATDEFATDLTGDITVSTADIAALKALTEGQSATITLSVAHPDTGAVVTKEVVVTVNKKTGPVIPGPVGDGPFTTSQPELLRADHVAYIVGFSDGTCRPTAQITRGEVATIFFRLLDEEVRKANLTTSNSFSDVNSATWCNSAVSTLSAMGIIKGRSNGRFEGSATITRAEFAAIAARFDTSEYSGSDKFSDISGHWAADLINRAAAKGWILGYNDGTFRPDQDITRAEAMTLANRVLVRQPSTVADLYTGMKTWSDNSDTSSWYYLAIQEATNSHEYTMKADQVHETWTALMTTPDWKTYE